MQDARWEPRQPNRGRYSLTWKGPDGRGCGCEAGGIDISSSGLGLECPVELKTGAIVGVKAREGSMQTEYEVVHCASRGAKFHVGLELRHAPTHTGKQRPARPRVEAEPDHYETLQISRKADLQTVHRVFRMMASRFHPDNPESGDVEQFLRLKQAYSVLSDAERRREYDATLEGRQDEGPKPIFQLKDFVTGVEAEANRRLGVLCILYTKRQTDPDHPAVSLLDLERDMGFPREYLAFTMWYLRAKDFVTAADNSDYSLTAGGADFVEENAARNEIMARLLNPGAIRFHPAPESPNLRPHDFPTGVRRITG
jgi:curved DNA-binding protein CbpA